jgi:hypothetical protein
MDQKEKNVQYKDINIKVWKQWLGITDSCESDILKPNLDEEMITRSPD